MKAIRLEPTLWVATIFGLALLTFALPSEGQSARCSGKADIMAQLDQRFGEQLLWQGLADNNHRLTVTANPDGTSWTALIERPDGSACPIASGKGWAVGAWSTRPQGTEG